MKTEIEHKRNSRRKGIALVIVLGFLAILTLMAVGMAISMRTERLASRSYLDMVKARLLCEAGLADSMQCLEEVLHHSADVPPIYIIAPSFYHYWSRRGYWEEGNDRVWTALVSLDSNLGADEKPDYVGDHFADSLVEGQDPINNFMPYLQEDYREVLGIGGRSGLTGAAEWIYTTTATPSGNSVTNGRYMYFIFSVGGRIDWNYAGREEFQAPYPMDPSQGYKVKKSLKEIQSTRARDVRYENLRDSRDKDKSIDKSRGSVAEFSYFPPMRRIEIVTNNANPRVEFVDDFNDGWPVVLTTKEANDADWRQRETEIKEAFDTALEDASWQNAEEKVSSEDLYKLLLDYIDEDWEPHDLKVPNIEAIPMINEIQTYTSNVVVEVWEPFVGPDRYEGGFTVNVDVNGNEDSEEGSIPEVDENRPIGPLEVDVELATSIPEEGADLTVSIEITDKTGSTKKVDEVEFRGVQRGQSWQCNDPRFNHLVSQWKKTSGNTLGDINENADYESNRGSGEYLKDGDYLMYCANRPLQVTGELGYLPVAPWRTIKLYDDSRDDRDNMDPVLDYFSMQENKNFNGRNETKYGLFNYNSFANYSRWAAFTCGTEPTDHYDLNAGLGLYIDQEAAERDKMGRIHTKRGFFIDKNVVVNLSDLGRFIINDARVAQVYSELRRESIMRRASQIVNNRQNLFTVLLWSQTLGDKEDGDFIVKAESQAIAQIWRDPYPVSNENQHHRKFVRYMRWME